ncbi:MAG: hypothetical protein ACFB0B_09010 [Thermonemataceae bacterium]
MRDSKSLKKRIFLTTGMFLFLIGLSLPLITLLFFQLKNLYWSIPSSILPITLGGHLLYYLEINNEKLIVKNLIFFWIHKEYKKTQIIDIKVYINYGTSEDGHDFITKGILIKTKKESKKYLMDYNYKYYIDLFDKLKKFKYKNSIFSRSPLVKKIITRPNEKVHITFEKLKNKEYFVADNNKLTKNITTSLFWFKVFFGLGCFFLVLIFVIGVFDGRRLDELFVALSVVNFVFIVPILIGLYYLFLYVVGGKKEVVFNRKENTITYPSSNYNKKTITIPFNKFKFYRLLKDARHALKYSLITRDNSNENAITGVFELYVGRYSDDFYSYLVWYMDNRRPLPPGEVFDIYRKVDYEQRKEKNFLKPLYSTSLKTPESTRKEQKQREQINNW